MVVLSLFPGIGMLDMAFEEEGFCVVRGPDLLWGGDVKRFRPPAGKFDGVIGGPPCQAFTGLGKMSEKRWGSIAENLIPEFERVIDAAQPKWFVMENVAAAPLPAVSGYTVRDQVICDHWVGGHTPRERRFSFGQDFPFQTFRIETMTLHHEPTRGTVTKLNTTWDKAKQRPRSKANADEWPGALVAQGLPADFLEHAPFTTAGKWAAIGNGVPLPMGRAVARAVKAAISMERAA